MVRIDYMPSREALAVFEARRARERPGTGAATNGAILDAILAEWAEMTGINCKEIERPKSLGNQAISPQFEALIMTLGIEGKPKQRRVVCGAKRHRDGKPCQALSEPGKRRCRFHGGRSTGPKTPEGKAKCAANLPNGRKRLG